MLVGEEGAFVGDEELGGVGWGGGADVGGEVGERDVDFVADTGDGGDFGSGDGASEGFVVKGGEVVGAAAAADEDDDFGLGFFVELLEGADDLLGGLEALDLGVDDVDDKPAGAFAKDFDEIFVSGGFGGADDGDAVEVAREGAFAFRGEEAFLGEFSLETLEGELDAAGADGLDGGDDEGEFAESGVKFGAGFDFDFPAVFEGGFELPGGAEAGDFGRTWVGGESIGVAEGLLGGAMRVICCCTLPCLCFALLQVYFDVF